MLLIYSRCQFAARNEVFQVNKMAENYLRNGLKKQSFTKAPTGNHQTFSGFSSATSRDQRNYSQ